MNKRHPYKKKSKDSHFSLNKDPEFWVSVLKEMMLYRRFEERVLAAYTQQKFSGFCHLHIGQEGLCVGVQRALKDTDYMISGYRSHTQAIAKGIPVLDVFAELFGRVTGCSRGKGGSMHMFSKKKRFYGGHGIVGGQAPIAVGMAWKVHYTTADDIVVCYLGDAAMNQGQVFEAMNMACVWKLPVLFIIENNLYGMGTHIQRTTATGATQLYRRALGVNMEHSQVNGQDVSLTYRHVQQLVEHMRIHRTPHLLEALTYRYKGHSVSDPSLYRSKEEVQQYREQQDPIHTLSQQLQADNLCTTEDVTQWDTAIKQELRHIETEALQAPEPELCDAYKDVLAP